MIGLCSRSCGTGRRLCQLSDLSLLDSSHTCSLPIIGTMFRLSYPLLSKYPKDHGWSRISPGLLSLGACRRLLGRPSHWSSLLRPLLVYSSVDSDAIVVSQGVPTHLAILVPRCADRRAHFASAATSSSASDLRLHHHLLPGVNGLEDRGCLSLRPINRLCSGRIQA